MKWFVEMVMMVRKEYVFDAATKEGAVDLAKENILEQTMAEEFDFDYMVYEVDDTHTFQGGRS
jgi:hypothetical protein